MSNPPPHPMPLSTYPIEKLIQLWRNEALTGDQMIGHLLQHIAALEAQVQALQKEVQRRPKADG
jgi:hypothetical protein